MIKQSNKIVHYKNINFSSSDNDFIYLLWINKTVERLLILIFHLLSYLPLVAKTTSLP